MSFFYNNLKIRNDMIRNNDYNINNYIYDVYISKLIFVMVNIYNEHSMNNNNNNSNEYIINNTQNMYMIKNIYSSNSYEDGILNNKEYNHASLIKSKRDNKLLCYNKCIRRHKKIKPYERSNKENCYMNVLNLVNNIRNLRISKIKRKKKRINIIMRRKKKRKRKKKRSMIILNNDKNYSINRNNCSNNNYMDNKIYNILLKNNKIIYMKYDDTINGEESKNKTKLFDMLKYLSSIKYKSNNNILCPLIKINTDKNEYNKKNIINYLNFDRTIYFIFNQIKKLIKKLKNIFISRNIIYYRYFKNITYTNICKYKYYISNYVISFYYNYLHNDYFHSQNCF
ncbi:hypothetical protein PFLG_03103 [Plasmodium falciparum RAJ116]|uniref:Uncharacterized protein n=1 Tax=Plasmodium falciparum RAJ116 TaxID=580058 RepID=A0A0L0D115_PLAFA|nr:hypothetical protein PFLG_03103 [Plasmodium falciparum RAJ116]